MKKFSIYKITNKITNKVYIGQSMDAESRWKSHKDHARDNPVQLIHLSIIKHGIDNFEFEEIASCIGQEATDEAEIFIIAQENSFVPNGYNVTRGGGGCSRTYTEEQKQYMKDNWHAWHTPESLRKFSNSMRGRKLSEEHKIKISEANKGKQNCLGLKQSPEHIAKRQATIDAKYGSKVCNAPGCDKTNGYKVGGVRYCHLHARRLILNATLDLLPRKPPPNKGVPMSEETRQKLSVALKGRVAHNKGVPHTEETKAKLSKLLKGKVPPNKGIPMSEEQKLKLSIAHRSRPEELKLLTSQRLSAANKGRISPRKGVEVSEETKAKLRLANLGKPSARKIIFTNEQLNIIMKDLRSADEVAKDFKVNVDVIYRVRNELGLNRAEISKLKNAQKLKNDA